MNWIYVVFKHTCVRNITIETKGAARIGYNGFLLSMHAKDEVRRTKAFTEWEKGNRTSDLNYKPVVMEIFSLNIIKQSSFMAVVELIKGIGRVGWAASMNELSCHYLGVVVFPMYMYCMLWSLKWSYYVYLYRHNVFDISITLTNNYQYHSRFALGDI